jgi:hypothetical protein
MAQCGRRGTTMTKNQHSMNPPDRPGRPWYVPDVVLLTGFVLAYAAFIGVLHVIAYLLGLQRGPSLTVGVALIGLALLVLMLLLALAARMRGGWRRHILDRGRLTRLRLLTILGTVAYLILPFTRLGLPPYTTFTKGFRKYVLVNVNLNAMRTWLSMVDPKKCSDYVYDLTSGATIEDWWRDAEPWAKTVTPLNPLSAILLPDSGGHPAICIRWFGLFNGWGLVVGSKEMQRAPSGFSQYSEYRLPLDSGAYVWHERGGLWRLLRHLIGKT